MTGGAAVPCWTPEAVFVTLAYTGLLAWGIGVGVVQVYQGLRRPDALLNPLFRNKYAQWLFALHLLVCSAHLFVCGPLAVHYKSPIWYWGGLVALLASSLPLAVHLNRSPESFGKLIGRWLVARNVLEIAAHVAVAAAVTDWFYFYLLLWWLVAYRYIDVGPRRLLQTLYNTPEKLAARPWAPALNWAAITALYVLTFLAVYDEQVLYASPPDPDLAAHVTRAVDVVLVAVINLVVVVLTWILTRKYTDSRV